MKKIPLSDRLEYWKYQCASLTFLRAKEVAECLIENKNHPLIYQLLTSLYVLYGRPFKQRNEVRISEKLVPHEYIEEHSFLISLRDKMFAHVDTDGLPKLNIKNLNKVLLRVQNGEFQAGLASLLPIGLQLERTRDLCSKLQETCEIKSREIRIDAIDGSRLANLDYEIDLCAEDAYIIKLVNLEKYSV